MPLNRQITSQANNALGLAAFGFFAVGPDGFPCSLRGFFCVHPCLK
jgi:hypothetical protein